MVFGNDLFNYRGIYKMYTLWKYMEDLEILGTFLYLEKSRNFHRILLKLTKKKRFFNNFIFILYKQPAIL